MQDDQERDSWTDKMKNDKSKPCSLYWEFYQKHSFSFNIVKIYIYLKQIMIIDDIIYTYLDSVICSL